MPTPKTKPTQLAAEPKPLSADPAELIAQGWGDVPRTEIPADWRTRGGPNPATVEIPDWVTETPFETEYCLSMDHGTGLLEQDIQMTRAEFIELKRHLAKLRGYAVPEGESK